MMRLCQDFIGAMFDCDADSFVRAYVRVCVMQANITRCFCFLLERKDVEGEPKDWKESSCLYAISVHESICLHVCTHDSPFTCLCVCWKGSRKRDARDERRDIFVLNKGHHRGEEGRLCLCVLEVI